MDHCEFLGGCSTTFGVVVRTYLLLLRPDSKKSKLEENMRKKAEQQEGKGKPAQKLKGSVSN